MDLRWLDRGIGRRERALGRRERRGGANLRKELAHPAIVFGSTACELIREIAENQNPTAAGECVVASRSRRAVTDGVGRAPEENPLTTKTLEQHIEISPGVVGGKPRIRGRRIAVQDIVVWHERMGLGADEIAAEHDLSLAEVYAALSFYYDHRESIDEQMRQSALFVEDLRRKTPSKLWEKLHGRKG